MVTSMSCPQSDLLETAPKTAVSRTHLDVLQRDISIDLDDPIDVGEDISLG